MQSECQIRPARVGDAKRIFSLIREHADVLVVRSMANVVEHLDRFLVAVSPEGEVVGTIAYEILAEIGETERTSAELQSVCVAESQRGHGLGRRLVKAQLDRLDSIGIRQTIVLTFETEFFRRLGFFPADKHSLMHKLYRGCLNCSKHESPFTCPEVAMVRMSEES